jgi:excinuclease UvrABC ATPase subunit
VKAYGTAAAADVMAAAGTRCVECHDLKKGAQTVLSVKAKCEECHDPAYGKMLLDWKQEITKRENALAVALEEAKEYVARSKKAGKDVSRAETLIAEADSNYQVVSAGRGTHNFKLSRELLRVAQAEIDKVLAAKRGK